MIEATNVTGIVLCGGKGSRLDGRDKPLIELGSKTIIEHILDRLALQCDRILLSCTRNVALYETLNHEVVVDLDLEEGPLGGLNAALQSVTTEWVLTVPGDAPFVPQNLTTLLEKDAQKQGIAFPTADNQQHNLTMLMNRRRSNNLQTFYKNGGRAVKKWFLDEKIQSTNLDDYSVHFFNINTESQLAKASQLLASLNDSQSIKFYYFRSKVGFAKRSHRGTNSRAQKASPIAPTIDPKFGCYDY